MKVKMLENVQGSNIGGVLLYEDISVSMLEKGMEYRVDESLGAWMVEHGKAEKLQETKQPKAKEKKAGKDVENKA